MSANELRLEHNLDEIKESFIKCIHQENCDLSSIRNRFLAAIDAYIQTIKDFFSTKDGEGSKIHDIYKSVSDLSKKYRKVRILDSNYSHFLYKDYYSGMIVFIDNELQSIGNSDTVQHCDRIKEFIEKDSMFIDSLFDDGQNTKYFETSVYDGMANLELLIDFINELSSKKDYIGKLIDKIESLGSSTNEAAKKLVIFYALSTIRFSTKLIKSVFDDFETLRNSLNSSMVSDDVYNKLDSYTRPNTYVSASTGKNIVYNPNSSTGNVDTGKFKTGEFKLF